MQNFSKYFVLQFWYFYLTKVFENVLHHWLQVTKKTKKTKTKLTYNIYILFYIFKHFSLVKYVQCDITLPTPLTLHLSVRRVQLSAGRNLKCSLTIPFPLWFFFFYYQQVKTCSNHINISAPWHKIQNLQIWKSPNLKRKTTSVHWLIFFFFLISSFHYPRQYLFHIREPGDLAFDNLFSCSFGGVCVYNVTAVGSLLCCSCLPLSLSVWNSFHSSANCFFLKMH